MSTLEAIEILLMGGAGSIPVWWIIAKGFASIIANNLDTQEWGKWGDLLDWLASNDKKAKLTGVIDSDLAVARRAAKMKGVRKLMSYLG